MKHLSASTTYRHTDSRLTAAVRRHWRAAVIAVIATLLLVVGYLGFWHSIDVEISGSYKTTALHDARDVERARIDMRPGPSRTDFHPSGGGPLRKFLLVEIDWRGQQHMHWPAKNCSIHVLLAHSTGEVGAYTGGYAWNYSFLIDRAMAEHPQIPSRINSVGQREFSGSVFSINSEVEHSTLRVLLQSSTYLVPTSVRAGILFTCDYELIEFAWLPATDSSDG